LALPRRGGLIVDTPLFQPSETEKLLDMSIQTSLRDCVAQGFDGLKIVPTLFKDGSINRVHKSFSSLLKMFAIISVFRNLMAISLGIAWERGKRTGFPRIFYARQRRTLSLGDSLAY
jgi:hypothetical protein